MSYTRLGTLAFAALAFAAAPARAQFVHFGLTGGVTFPSGDFSQQQERGFNGGALLSFDAPMMPIGLRADASFHHFPGKDIAGVTTNTNMWMTTINATFGLPLPSPVRPYALAGIGYYGTISTVDGIPGSYSDKNFGMNAGLGMQFSRLFAEVRWHRINADNGEKMTVVPFSLGILF